MQNAIWKLSALAGVVGIGILVMFQVQQGLNQKGGQNADGSKIESTEASSPSANLGAPEQTPGKQNEPALADDAHEGHTHDAGSQDGATAFQASGIDFSKSGAGSAPKLSSKTTSSPAPAASSEEDPFGVQAKTATKQSLKTQVGARTAAVEDDPFADASAVPKGVKTTSHESDGETPSNAKPSVEVDEAKDPAGGAGPKLLPATDDSTAGAANPETSPSKSSSAPAVDFDPFTAGGETKKENKAVSRTGEPRALPTETDSDAGKALPLKATSKSDASSATNAAQTEKDHPQSNDSFPAPERDAHPRARLTKTPSRDQTATKSIDEKTNDSTSGDEPHSQLGRKGGDATEAAERGPALPENKSPFGGEKSENADTAQQNRRPQGGEHLHEEPSDEGPKITANGSEDSKTSGVPKSLAAPDEVTPLEPGPGSEFHGDGTIDGDAPLGPQRPQLTIEKVAPTNAVLGQPLIYSILVKNAGNSAAQDVVVEDRIPKGSKLSGTIPRAELSEKTLIWKLGNLGPGEQRKISVRVVPLEAGQIGSVATVNFVAEVAAETHITAPQLKIDLSGPSEAKLGEPVPFQFRVTNTGSGEASGVVIRDLIPEGLKHAAGNDLEYEVGRLPAGESREIRLALMAAKIGPTVNTAVVTADGGVKSEAKVSLEVYGTKLVVVRTGPTKRYVGRTAVYTNTVTNESTRPVEAATVTEVVPEGLDFVEASNGGQYNPGSRTIAWRLSRLGPGENRTLKVKLLPKSTGTLSSLVKAAAVGGDAVEITSQTIVEGFSAVALEIPSIESPVDVGEKTSLRIVARNRGNSPATNVELLIEVPAQFKVVSVHGPVKHEQSGNEVRFAAIPAIDGRTAAAFDIELEAVDKGDARLRVQIKGDHLERPLVREESILVLSDSQ